MPRVCSICSHPARDEIDEALVSGGSLRKIAGQFSIEYSSLHRHRQAGHMPTALVTLHSEKEAQRGASLLERVEHVVERCEAILDNAEKDGRPALALSAVRELRASLELLGKLTGEIKAEGPQLTVNLLASSDWIELQAAIFRALQNHPEAKQAVTGELKQLGSK